MSDLWLVTVPGWLTGAGTFALAATTVWLVKREGDDRRRLAEDAKSRLIAHRREQASLVSAWYAGVTSSEQVENPPGTTTAAPLSRLALSNRSDEPVYDVVVLLVLAQGAGPRTGEQLMELSNGRTHEDGSETLIASFVRVLGVVPPGLWQVRVDSGWGGMFRAPGAEVGYTDRSGVHWIRRINGALEEIEDNAMAHYGIPRPFSLTDPEPFNN